MLWASRPSATDQTLLHEVTIRTMIYGICSTNNMPPFTEYVIRLFACLMGKQGNNQADQEPLAHR